MYELSLDQGYSVPTMIGVAAIAIVLAAIFYYRTFGLLPAFQWQWLLVLRIVAIVIVVLLLFRPTLIYQEEQRQRPSLVFMIDTSASMGISDDASGQSRLSLARAQVQKWWDMLHDDFTVHLYEFSDSATGLSEPSQLATLEAKGQSTSLAAAMTTASKAAPRRDIVAALLLTDGINNTAKNPLDVAGKLGVTFHTIGVGASLRTSVNYRDVQVTGIEVADRLMLNNKAAITGLVEHVGLTGRVLKVVFEEDGKQLGDRELTLGAVEGPQKVEFEFLPANKGRHTYTVRVPPLPEEKIIENNARSTVSTVFEPGIRILYIEGTARSEFGAIADRFLAKDPDLEFYALAQTRTNVFLKRTNIQGMDLGRIPSDEETINKFDVFVLGDLDSSFLRAPQQAAIVKRVRAGGGLIMLGGYHSLGPGGYTGTPIGDILPMLLGGRDIGQVNDPFLPLLTPDGARHPIFANIAGFFSTKTGGPKQAGLPDLDGCTRVQAARPGATVLAVHPTEGSQMPILAVQPVEKGRTAVFCGDTTRKWQQGPRALDQESPFLRFWGQVVRYLAGRTGAVEAKASVTASTDKLVYEPESPVRISAIVRDQNGEGASAASVSAKVRDPMRQLEDWPMAPGAASGHFEGAYLPKGSGSFEIYVEAKVGQLTVTSDKTTVQVGRTNLEFEKLDMDEKMLAKIAADSHGRYVHITAAGNLIDQLDRSEKQKTVRKERPLFWPPGFWLAFVVVLTVEWVLRRRYQLR